MPEPIAPAAPVTIATSPASGASRAPRLACWKPWYSMSNSSAPGSPPYTPAALPSAFTAGAGPGDPEGQRLRADQMIRGEWRGQRQLAATLAVDEREHLGRDERPHDDTAVRPVGIAGRLGQAPAQHRCDLPHARQRRLHRRRP